MAASLRFVDPSPPPGVVRRAYSALAATRVALFVSRHVAWHLDLLLLTITRGRVSSGLMLPTAVLETRGARSALTRRHAVIYFHPDGPTGRVIVVASNAGVARHPAWYWNLLAHPDVSLGGVPMRAAVINDETEREQLWHLADRIFPAYAIYRRRAATFGREIPLIQLTPPAR